MQVFVLGVPHTKTIDPRTSPFTTCAFTAKVWDLCLMLHGRGHEVFHLGVEGSAPRCSEHIDVVPLGEWEEHYGWRDSATPYDVRSDGFFVPYMQRYADNVRATIQARCKGENSAIVCATFDGPAQRTSVEGLPQVICESGIGYNCPWAQNRVYESYAWMHFHLGREGKFGGNEPNHVVIPSAFDPDLFGPVLPQNQREGYALYMGRLNEDKGVRLACETARAAGMPIKIVGQGNPAPFVGPGVEYHKPAGAEERRELLRRARVLLCPTQYVEPFGRIAVEAAMSGTPVISTDWGAFPEHVIHGQTGYRCRTREQFLWAAMSIDRIDPEGCRAWAVDNFSLDRVALMYEEYFEGLLRERRDGPNPPNDSRQQLDWLVRDYSMLS